MVLINQPERYGTLNWHWYTAVTGKIRTHDHAIASLALYHTLDNRQFVKIDMLVASSYNCCLQCV